MPYLGRTPEIEVQQQSAPISAIGASLLSSATESAACEVIQAAKKSETDASLVDLQEAIQNLTQIVNNNAIVAARLYSSGDYVISCSNVAPPGTLNPNGQTIGNTNSGATARANADTQALYTILWNSSTQSELPIQTSSGSASSRGLNAAADFSSNKRLPLPSIQDGDSLIAAVTSAVNSRSVGAVISHTHTGTTTTDGAHTHSYDGTNASYNISLDDITLRVGNPGTGQQTGSSGAHSHTFTTAATGGAKNLATGTFVKVYIAL